MQLDFATKVVICILVGMIFVFCGLIYYRHNCMDHGDIRSPDYETLSNAAPMYEGPDNADTFEQFSARGAGSMLTGGWLKKRY